MNADEHQRERMRAWASWAATTNIEQVDWLLAEFDKRFPAPTAVEPVPAEPPMLFARTLAAMEERDAAAELAALREKARLWDAVRSGKMKLVGDTASDPVTWWTSWRGQSSGNKATAEEAVQAAIDAGALK